MSSGSNHPGGSKQVYKVRIFNQTYSISSSAGEAEFQQIADQVDLLMQTIASRSGTAEGVRVGVLAAMHLADKLRHAERRLEALEVGSEADHAEVDTLRAEAQAYRSAAQTYQAEAEALRAESESLLAHIGERTGQLDRLLQQAMEEELPEMETPRAAAAAAALAPNPARLTVVHSQPSSRSMEPENPTFLEATDEDAAESDEVSEAPEEASTGKKRTKEAKDEEPPPLFGFLDWQSRATSAGE